MTGAAPSGVVTFLFTDVEGSTRRWEADPDEMRAALTAHDEVLRAAIETHGGFMFKHTGDGVCAAFSSPRSAVDAAVAGQRGLELPVRMGLATGEAEIRDGDYFGAILNRTARVMAAGHGGQILLADSTAGLLSGVDLVDLGPRRLRDLPTPVGWMQGLASTAAVAAVIALVIGVIDAFEVSSRTVTLFGRTVGPQIGWGLWLVLITSVVLAVTAGIVAWQAPRVRPTFGG
jgi:class 3 adenylate cyclase